MRKFLKAHSALEGVVEIHQHPTWLRYSFEQPIVAGQPSQLPLLYPIQHGTVHDCDQVDIQHRIPVCLDLHVREREIHHRSIHHRDEFPQSVNQSQRIDPHHDSQICQQGHATILLTLTRIRRHLIVSRYASVLLQEILEQESPPVFHLPERGGFQLRIELTTWSLELFRVTQQHKQITQSTVGHGNQSQESIQSQICQRLGEEIRRSLHEIFMTKCHV